MLRPDSALEEVAPALAAAAFAGAPASTGAWGRDSAMRVPDRLRSRHSCFARAGLWALEPRRIGGGSPQLDFARPAAPAVRRAGEEDVVALSRALGGAPARVARRLAPGQRC